MRRSIELGGFWIACAMWMSPAQPADELDEVMRHASEMAQGGNWREAVFRWEQARKLAPENPRILNNLAVAYEVMDQLASARDLYHRSAVASDGDPVILDNARKYTQNLTRSRPEHDNSVDAPPPLEFGNYPTAKKNSKSKTFRVAIGEPLPANLRYLSGDETLLGATFLVGRNDPSMPNVELARYLQAGLRNHERLGVIDIETTPVRAGQSFEDVIANRYQWRLIGLHRNADLIVTGAVNYSRLDVSGRHQGESADDTESEDAFVEQEQFRFMVDVYFMNGRSGLLLLRERVESAVVVAGVDNDPIEALVKVQEQIAAELFRLVSARVRPDTRLVFKN